MPPFSSDNPTPPAQTQGGSVGGFGSLLAGIGAGLSITVGTVAVSDNSAAYNDPSNDPLAVWEDYQVRNRYEMDHHRYLMAVASPAGFQGKTAKLVQLAAETLIWVADWTAARWNTQPSIPDPDPGDPTWEILDAHLELPNLLVAADGVTPIYRVTGTYYYAKTAVPDPVLTNNATFAQPAWLKAVFDRTVPNATLQKGIISAGSVGVTTIRIPQATSIKSPPN